MATDNQKRAWGGTGLAAGVVAFAHFVAGVGGHGLLDSGATAIKNYHDVSGVLTSLDDGTYAKKQITGAFCAAVTSIDQQGTLPDQATDWSSFLRARTGTSTTSVDGYTQGKIDELGTAVSLAEQNPQAARRYVETCKPFGL